jgi:hypothetical protein
MLSLVTLIAVSALLGESPALAKGCKVQSSKAPGQWTFVRVHDVDTGQVVLRQGINGGDSKHVTVSGHRIRIEHKLAGHKNYRSDAVADCKGGNTVKF